jgi:hypothetical protein
MRFMRALGFDGGSFCDDILFSGILGGGFWALSFCGCCGCGLALDFRFARAKSVLLRGGGD